MDRGASMDGSSTEKTLMNRMESFTGMMNREAEYLVEIFSGNQNIGQMFCDDLGIIISAAKKKNENFPELLKKFGQSKAEIRNGNQSLDFSFSFSHNTSTFYNSCIFIHPHRKRPRTERSSHSSVQTRSGKSRKRYIGIVLLRRGISPSYSWRVVLRTADHRYRIITSSCRVH